MRSTTIIATCLLAGLLFTAATSQASTITVTLNTTGLPAGDYLFDFQFINGDNTNGNNTSLLSGFASTNLTLGALSTFGTVTGSDLVSGLTLTDGPFTEVDQAFTATAAAGSLSFLLNYSANYAPPGPGDAFTFAITDTSLNSTRSAGNGAELEVDLSGANPPVNTFAADAGSGGFQPGVTGNSTATPEVSTAGLSACGLLLFGLLAKNARTSHNCSSIKRA